MILSATATERVRTGTEAALLDCCLARVAGRDREFNCRTGHLGTLLGSISTPFGEKVK